MTTIHMQDIKRKKSVVSRYAPNSYRIFSEDIDNSSLPYNQVYARQESQLYTKPLIVPAQCIEERNKPHANRNAEFLRENVMSINEPINNIKTRMNTDIPENQWWKWTVPKDEMDSALKNRKKITEISTFTNNPNEVSPYSTTYQKDMGYMNKSSVNDVNNAAYRQAFNPNGNQAVGIVPINDLSTYSKVNGEQRVFTDKMSFEHNSYDSRSANNYNQRGRRQGAFVIEEPKSTPMIRRNSRPPTTSGESVWSAMHPGDKATAFESDPRKRSGLKKAPSSGGVNGQRRDPIGYFNDNGHGGSMLPAATRMANNHSMNGAYEMNYPPVEKTIARFDAPLYGDNNPQNFSNAGNNNINNSYEPSWNQNNDRYEPAPPMNNGPYDQYDYSRSNAQYMEQNPNELLDQAMNVNNQNNY